MGSAPRDDSAGQERRLYPEELLLARRVDAYYEVLSRDETFNADLQQLLEVIRRRPFSSARDAFLLAIPPARAVPLLDAFVAKWHLPRRHGVEDLWDSLCQAALAGTPPVVGLGGRSSIGPTERVIVPPVPPPFEYDPTRQSLHWVREKADQIADDVRRAIIAQAEEFERIPGWATIPPQHHDLARLRRTALRLYRRAVLGLPWQRIADKETEETGEHCDRQSVRTTVGSWAAELDVPLPERRGGRPPRPKPVS